MIPKQNVSVKQSPACSYHSEHSPCPFPVLAGSSLCAVHYGFGLPVNEFLEQLSPVTPPKEKIHISEMILDKVIYSGPSRTIRSLCLSAATMNEVDIQNWMLQNIIIKSSACDSSRLRQCAIDTVEISDTTLAQLSLESCSLMRLRLTDCKLLNLRLEHINLRHLFIGNCHIENLIVNESRLEDIEFLDMENMRISIRNSVLKNCQFPPGNPGIELVDCKILPNKKP
jgi:hypothetical protein